MYIFKSTRAKSSADDIEYFIFQFISMIRCAHVNFELKYGVIFPTEVIRNNSNDGERCYSEGSVLGEIIK